MALSLVFQLINFVPSVTAEAGTVTEFSGGFAIYDLELNGSLNYNASINSPRNITYMMASFDLDYTDDDSSPGKIWLDINEDGSQEWAWNTTGYGNLGSQNVFSTGASTSIAALNSSGGVSMDGILLPSEASLSAFSMNVTFAPELGGGFFAIGPVTDIKVVDFDNDTLPEVVLLSDQPGGNTTVGTSIGWLEWDTQNGSMSNVTWLNTCDNATNLRSGDITGDGKSELATYDFNEIYSVYSQW